MFRGTIGATKDRLCHGEAILLEAKEELLYNESLKGSFIVLNIYDLLTLALSASRYVAGNLD